MPPSIPIRTRLTLLRDGTTQTSCSVFCERKLRSIDPTACADCGGGVVRDSEARPAIACPPAAMPRAAVASPDAWAVARRRPVGLAVSRRVVCVMEDTPLHTVAAALSVGPSAFGVPVVDRNHRLVGLLASAATTLALLGSAGWAPAGQHARSTPALGEAEDLGEAMRALGARHARELIVLGADQEVVGVMRDIDALRVVAAVSRARV